MNKPWKSYAEWPEGVYTDPDGTHVSEDGHDTEAAARCVCGRLEDEGFGGEGQDFPVRTWVGRNRAWWVQGDHPTLKRPDKRFEGDGEQARAQEYAAVLILGGYENVTCEEIKG